jgi:VWFA-related protein
MGVGHFSANGRSRLARIFTLLVIVMWGWAMGGQQINSSENLPITLESTSTFVSVPTSVRTEYGIPVRNLNADQFRLLDQGVPQKVIAVKTDDLPISLVILMQTGGSASRQFSSYIDLPTLLDKIIGGSEHEITLATFDSKIEQVWHFPLRSDGVFRALTSQQPGDGGAAIRDAVSFGVNQLQGEAGRFRRLVLLLSEDTDQGSTVSSRELLEQLGMASTVVHSIVFPGRKPKSKIHNSRARSAEPSQISNAPASALGALDSNTAAEIASETGGDYAKFVDRASFNSALIEAGDEIGEGYMLGFQPSQHTAGFHSLRVNVAAPHSTFNVIARNAYWFSPATHDHSSEGR